MRKTYDNCPIGGFWDYLTCVAQVYFLLVTIFIIVFFMSFTINREHMLMESVIVWWPISWYLGFVMLCIKQFSWVHSND
jgi:hypothetical protein